MHFGSTFAVFLHTCFGTASVSNTVLLNAMQGALKRFLNRSLLRYTQHPTIKDVTWLWSLTNGMFFLGFFTGTLIMRPIAEKRGRKICTIFLNDSGTIVGSALIMTAKWTNYFELLLLGRFVLGLSRPCGSFIRVFTYECCGSRSAAFGSSVVQFGCIAWLALSSAIGMPQVLGNEDHWELVMLPQIIAASIHLGLGYSILPESPKHLFITDNNREKATKAIIFYQGIDSDVDSELEQLEREAQLVRNGSVLGLKDVITSSYYKWPFLLTVTCGVVSCGTGLIYVKAYSTSILVRLGLSEQTGAGFSCFVIMVPALISCPFGILATRKISRRKHLFTGLSVMCVGSLSIMISLFVAPFITVSQCLAVFGMVCVAISSWSSVDIVAQIIPGEICPQNIRSLCWSARLFSSHLLSALELFLIPPLLNSLGPIAISPLFLLCIVSFLFLNKHLPETFNVALDVTVRKWEENEENVILMDH